jgi:DNA-binding FadR family transcriptional regulator
VLARLEGSHLITVREGDRVVVGNSTAATLTHARALLDAGDLGGAARAVGTLTGPAAEKMAPWLADAKALQAAREALAALAEKG